MSIQLTGQFNQFFTETALPRLVGIVQDQVNPKGLKPVYSRIFKVVPCTADTMQYGQLTSLGLASKTTEDQAYFISKFGQGNKRSYTPVKYTNGYGLSEEFQEDMGGTKITEAYSMSEHLGRSLRETREVVSAGPFNTAFTLNQPYDGVTLCNGAHPNESPLGVPQSNTITDSGGNAIHVDISHTAIRQLMVQAMLQKDSAGKLQPAILDTIIVPAQTYFDMTEIVRSVDRSDTSNRAMNVLMSNDEMPIRNIIPHRYITNSQYWFMTGQDHYLIFAQKRDVKIVVREDFNTEAVVVKASIRFDMGPANWRDFYGCK